MRHMFAYLSLVLALFLPVQSLGDVFKARPGTGFSFQTDNGGGYSEVYGIAVDGTQAFGGDTSFDGALKVTGSAPGSLYEADSGIFQVSGSETSIVAAGPTDSVQGSFAIYGTASDASETKKLGDFAVGGVKLGVTGGSEAITSHYVYFGASSAVEFRRSGTTGTGYTAVALLDEAGSNALELASNMAVNGYGIGAIGDVFIAANSKDINFTTDRGATINLKIGSSGITTSVPVTITGGGNTLTLNKVGSPAAILFQDSGNDEALINAITQGVAFYGENGSGGFVEAFRYTDTDITAKVPLEVDGIIKSTGKTVGITGGGVTPTSSVIFVDGETNGVADDLTTITNGETGRFLVIFANGGETITVKDGTGNLQLAGDFVMNSTQDSLMLVGVGTSWYEVSRSNNN